MNPGFRTLLSFLRLIRKKAPATFYELSKERKKAYGMITRYLKFCLQNDLIKIASETQGRGPNPSKKYVLNERGTQLLQLLEGVDS